jgi:hypothetical protein
VSATDVAATVATRPADRRSRGEPVGRALYNLGPDLVIERDQRTDLVDAAIEPGHFRSARPARGCRVPRVRVLRSSPAALLAISAGSRNAPIVRSKSSA